MVFAAPWLLLALIGLPLLWWLLRVVPPAPRRQVFPAVRLLLALPLTLQTPARTPPWLLLLRLAVAALLIVGLAGPVLQGGSRLPGRGPLLLVIDDGWAAAADWPARQRAAQAILRRAATAGRAVAVLTTAPPGDGAAGLPLPPGDLGPRLAVLQPQPWPTDRGRAASAVAAWTRLRPGSGAVWLTDGLTDGAGWDRFASALYAAGPVLAVAAPLSPARLLLPPVAQADGFGVTVAAVPRPVPGTARVLAETADGRSLAGLAIDLPPGAARASATLDLPIELRNQVDRLVLLPTPGETTAASGVALVDEASRRRLVGIASDGPAADTPLAGSAYYVARALKPYAELREGGLETLLAQHPSVVVLPDRPVEDGPQATRLSRFVDGGGLLLRFAGPQMAQGSADQQPDPLLPVPLLGFERELGGTMSWGKPASLAPFAPDSPFAGLPLPGDVAVTRQVLADPAGDLTTATWARLADGTPLVTQRVQGHGRIVLFHVTANADWSNLPLSGLFVDMLRRIVALSTGAAPESLGSDAAPLMPAQTLDGAGVLGPPPASALPIARGGFATAVASPAHPPGFYGPESARRALNLADRLPLPQAAPRLPGSTTEALGRAPASRPLGWLLVVVATLLLALDLLLSIWLRGLLPAAAAGALAVLLLLLPVAAARAQAPPPDATAALATRLAYIQSGDAEVDDIARAGLAGLSAYVNDRTAAVLADPVAVTPGADDLSFYPLLYWPLVADNPPLDAGAIAALNAYMAHGGIILIDTRDGGSGAGMAPGTGAVLRQLGQGGAGGLLVPPLAPLTEEHVLAHAFYLLSDFPGRYAGDTVWVARDQDRSNDSVSPVVVGGHDWAAAWATDAQGRHPYATIPGGDRQRTLAYRFGVNLVIYALTGNYKGDQVHVPALLERMGQ